MTLTEAESLLQERGICPLCGDTGILLRPSGPRSAEARSFEQAPCFHSRLEPPEKVWVLPRMPWHYAAWLVDEEEEGGDSEDRPALLQVKLLPITPLREVGQRFSRLTYGAGSAQSWYPHLKGKHWCGVTGCPECDPLVIADAERRKEVT